MHPATVAGARAPAAPVLDPPLPVIGWEGAGDGAEDGVGGRARWVRGGHGGVKQRERSTEPFVSLEPGSQLL